MLAGSRERAPHAKIAHVLRGLVDRHGWEAMTEGDNIIGAQVFLTCQRDHSGNPHDDPLCSHGECLMYSPCEHLFLLGANPDSDRTAGQ